MKYIINRVEVKAMVEAMNLIEDGQQVWVQMGVGSLRGDSIMCCLRVTGRTEQILTHFSALPEEEDGEKESFIASTKHFSGVLSAMLSYDKDIVLELKEKSVEVSAAGLASVSVDKMIGEYELPEITMDKTEPILFCVSAEIKDFSVFLKEGCVYADAVKGNGCENIIWQFNLKEGTLQGFSTDGFLIGRSNTSIVVSQDCLNDGSKNALEQYFAQKPGESLEKVIALVPDKASTKIMKITEGLSQVKLAVDSKHLFVCVGRNIYAVTMGAQMLNVASVLKEFETTEVTASFALPLKEVARAVQTIKKISAVKKGNDKVCMHVTIENAMLCLTADNDTVKVAIENYSDAAEIDFFCYAHLFEKAMAGVLADKIIIQNLTGNGPVRFLKEKDSFSMVYMLKARNPVSE